MRLNANSIAAGPVPAAGTPAPAGSWFSRMANLMRREADRPAVADKSKEFRLLRYFCLTSALVFLMTAGVFVSIYGWHQKRVILDAAKSRNISLIQVISKTIWWSHAEYLSSVGHLNGDALRARLETQEINRELRTVLLGMPVLKVKIFHPNGKAIYSTDSVQIGQNSSLTTEEFEKVKQGEMPFSRVSFRPKFNSLDGDVQNVYVTETYVPLTDSMGSVNAVFELYADVTAEMMNLRQNTWQLAMMALSLFGGLYCILYLIMRRADGLLRSQHSALVVLNNQLEAESAKTAALNAALEEKLVQLERSNQDLQDFAHVASHDLQEPLRKIEAFGDRLARRYGKTLPEDGQMFIERMQDASSRMRKLINDLLTYARSVNKQAPTEKVELKNVLDGVLSDLQVRIEESNAEIKVGKLYALEADPAQMRQLLQNLIANSLKFRRKDTRPVIEISSTLACTSDDAHAADQVVLKVADNGVGFDPKLAHKLFKVFHRLHGRSEYEGSGIGLATCRKIVERHGGTIVADGKPGEGATFTVTLPLTQPEAAAHPSRAVAPAPATAAAAIS